MKIRFLLFVVFTLSVSTIYSQENSELKLDFNSKKQQYGFRNHKKKLIIDYTYTFAEPFQEGLALVENNLKFGFINNKGQIVIELKYSDAGSFSEGLGYFSYDLAKYGYINKKGDVVIEPKFDGAYDFKNGYAKVLKLNPDTSKYGNIQYIQGLIDKSGNLIGKQWFSFVHNVTDSIVEVMIKKDIFNFNLSKGELQAVLKDDDTENKKLIVEAMPEFPGGDLGLRRYIASMVIYPASARAAGIEGKTYTRFAVSKTGKVINVETARKAHPLLDKESIRVIRELPQWKPGMQDGKPVTVWYTVPINFALQ